MIKEDIEQIAKRIASLREIIGIGSEEMAKATGMSEQEYLEYESGKHDFSFSFLYTVAHKCGVDITDIITGEGAKLSRFSLVKSGQGLAMERRKEYKYQHLAYIFKNRNMEPFLVTVQPSDVDAATHKKSHDGQEMNYVVEGSMTVFIGQSSILLEEGDTLYFDAKVEHAMQAMGGKPCKFLAIIAD